MVTYPYTAAAPLRFGLGSVNSTIHFSGSGSPFFHTFPFRTAVLSACSTVNFAVYHVPGFQSNGTTTFRRVARASHDRSLIVRFPSCSGSGLPSRTSVYREFTSPMSGSRSRTLVANRSAWMV